jgi:murein DD-endopeptidase MepM/ murein hydrolase activator NlpD
MSEASKIVEEAKAVLEVEKQALEESKAELAETEKVLEGRRAEADKLLAELIATGEEYEALLDEAEEAAADLKDDISDAQDAYNDKKKQEEESKKPASGGSNTTTNAPSSDGSWKVPCKYKRVSSAYGWRIHPVYGYKKFHYGVDLAASSGTPIVASRSGKVTTAKYSSSAGYYVTLDHGDGFSSQYMHMTHYIVKNGQQVQASEVIGYVGSTGASTGPHLHFSILYKGSHVNPANYIKI